jgi:hypothetical protein
MVATKPCSDLTIRRNKAAARKQIETPLCFSASAKMLIQLSLPRRCPLECEGELVFPFALQSVLIVYR